MYRLEDFLDDMKELFKSEEEKNKEKEKYKRFKEQEAILTEDLRNRHSDWVHKHAIDPNKYDSYFEPSLSQTRKEYNNTSLDDIRKRAKRDNLYDYTKGKDAVLSKYENIVDKAKREEDRANEDEKDALLDLKNKYENARRSAKAKNHRNGILKSSIDKLVDSELGDNTMRNGEEIRIRRDKRVFEAMKDLDKKTRDRDNALKALSMDYDNAVEKSIERDLDKKKKYNDEVTKYNNQLDEKDKEYQIKRERIIKELKNNDIQNEKKRNSYEYYMGYYGAKKDEYANRAKMAYDLYSQMPSKTALDAIKQNTNLKIYLGKYYGPFYQAIAAL